MDLIQDETQNSSPVALIRQKSRPYRRDFTIYSSQLPFPRQPDNQLPRLGDHLDLLPGIKSQLRHPVALKGNGR